MFTEPFKKGTEYLVDFLEVLTRDDISGDTRERSQSLSTALLRHQKKEK